MLNNLTSVIILYETTTCVRYFFYFFFSWLARATGSTDEEKDADAREDLTQYAAFLLDMVSNFILYHMTSPLYITSGIMKDEQLVVYIFCKVM